MKEIFEIRIHGRGGQGAKTAAHILACSALKDRYFIQALPEFGPERGGAPMKSYLRISKKQILTHENIKEPDLVAVIDPTLIHHLEILEGLGKDKILIVNTTKSPGQIKDEIGFTGKLFTVDATKISLECMGKNIPNTPILGAIVKASRLFSLQGLKKEFESEFTNKIGKENVEKNLQALERAYQEVQVG